MMLLLRSTPTIYILPSISTHSKEYQSSRGVKAMGAGCKGGGNLQ